MRVLVVAPGPKFSVQDVFDGYVEALEQLLGVSSVATFDIDDYLTFFSSMKRADFPGDDLRKVFEDGEAALLASKHLEAVLYEFWPDLMVVVSGFYIPEQVYELARKRGVRIAMIHTEEPYEHGRCLQRAQHVDFNIVNDPELLADYPTGTIYLPHAYRPSRHCPGPAVPEYKSDVCFIGSGYKSRADFIMAVDWDGIDLALGGNWNNLPEKYGPLHKYVAHEVDECLDNSETVKAYRSTKASFNLYRVESMDDGQADGWAMGPREVELAACGTWFARQSRPEGDALFPMLPLFATPEELGDQLRWALSHEDEREDVAEAARAAVADRTFDVNARSLLQLL